MSLRSIAIAGLVLILSGCHKKPTPDEKDRLLIARIQRLILAEKTHEAAAEVTPEATERIQALLEASPHSFAGNISAQIGTLVGTVGRVKESEKWLEFGLSQDPDNRLLKKLSETLPILESGASLNGDH